MSPIFRFRKLAAVHQRHNNLLDALSGTAFLMLLRGAILLFLMGFFVVCI